MRETTKKQKRKQKTVFFATSNRGKAIEAKEILAPYGIRAVPRVVELSEPRADSMSEVALAKAMQALALTKKPVLVEDTGIFFAAYNNFPGVYSKFFVTAVGLKGVARILKGASRKAFFQTIVGFAAPGKKPRLFVGRCWGKIVAPRGKPHHEKLPYDAVFVPSCSRKTFAEITRAQKARFSHRAKAFRAFGEWFSHA